jgi:hypothetical protein
VNVVASWLTSNSCGARNDDEVVGAPQALLLLNQCIMCHTPTFCSGFGSQLAAYCLTTDALVTAVVNGYGCGSPLSDITLVPPPDVSPFDHGRDDVVGLGYVSPENAPVPCVADARSFDMFLDEASGDLFSYHRGLSGWLPHVNCGLHRYNLRPEESGRATSTAIFKYVYRAVPSL